MAVAGAGAGAGAGAAVVPRAVAAPERLDMIHGGRALQALEQAVAAPGAVTIDLAPLTRFDSGALAVLLALGRLKAGEGGLGKALLLVDPAPGLRALAGLYGLSDVLFGPSA